MSAASPAPLPAPIFDKVALIGIGLIGGSIALAARRGGLARTIVAATRRAETAEAANRLKLVDHCGTDLAGHLNSDVLRFAAGGFRDFTRIAASDPTMWRDVFLNNREAVLEVLARFQEDLFYLQRAIRWGEGDKLFELFSRTREIRRALIHLNQA